MVPVIDKEVQLEHCSPHALRVGQYLQESGASQLTRKVLAARKAAVAATLS
jgi:hypothetical protein